MARESMTKEELVEGFVGQLVAWTVVAVPCAVGACGGWIYLARRGRRLLPPQRTRCVPWTGLEVWTIVFMVQIFWPAIVIGLLSASGLFEWWFGTSYADLAKEQPGTSLRVNLWLSLLLFPLELGTILLVVRSRSGARAYQLGVTNWRLCENLVLGALCWLFSTPAILVIHALANLLNSTVMKAPSLDHPFVEIALHGAGVPEMAAIMVLALIAAPISEELLFRGFMQPWFASRSFGGNAAMVAALGVACMPIGIEETWNKIWLWPLLFVYVMIPGYLFCAWVFRRVVPDANAARSIYATSLLWATFHYSEWPAPIPLFVFGLVLGYLAYRTQSLVAPVLLHGLFNAIACFALIYALAVSSEPTKGNATTVAPAPPAVATTVNAVPGSWLPRRTYPSAMAQPTRGENAADVRTPTSLPSLYSVALAGTVLSALRPTSTRLTWP
jgi:membrane protease YdiL (CAAX protease family)